MKRSPILVVVVAALGLVGALRAAQSSEKAPAACCEGGTCCDGGACCAAK